VVQGDSGIGKSALLANWAKGYRESIQTPEGLLFEHYAAASADSARVDTLLTRFYRRINRHLKGDEPEGTWRGSALEGLSRIGGSRPDPDRSDELRRALPSGWRSSPAKKPHPSSFSTGSTAWIRQSGAPSAGCRVSSAGTCASSSPPPPVRLRMP
jgi:hypothetical protein